MLLSSSTLCARYAPENDLTQSNVCARPVAASRTYPPMYHPVNRNAVACLPTVSTPLDLDVSFHWSIYLSGAYDLV
jgi:hypothetical protein